MSNDTDTYINISDLDKAEVLATLFNASSPAGMGFLQAGNGPTVMSIEDAQAIIDRGTSPDFGSHFKRDLYFDYLYGRPLKLNLANDSFDPWGFDRDNGGTGTAERLISELRNSGAIDSDAHKEVRNALLIERSDKAMTMANTPSTTTVEGGIPTFNMGGNDIGEILEKAIDQEIMRHGI